LCNLGDIIDGQCSFKTDSLREIDGVLEKFSKLNDNVETLNLIGNHELYNFSRDELNHILHTCRNGGHAKGVEKEYYHYKPCDGFRIIVIDPYQDTVIGLQKDDPLFQKASDILMKNNKNMSPEVYNGGGSWYDGVDGVERRFVPFNGGLGKDQIDWLSAQLKEAHEQGFFFFCESLQ
jgi:manganese-dependent ADP-ribose/CDP-alcohol diphosphatase